MTRLYGNIGYDKAHEARDTCRRMHRFHVAALLCNLRHQRRSPDLDWRTCLIIESSRRV